MIVLIVITMIVKITFTAIPIVVDVIPIAIVTMIFTLLVI